jgi:hypothetical protein
MSMDNRMLAAIGFLAILALVAKPVWDGREQLQFGPGQDDGVYMVTAKSLAEGQGYRLPNLRGHPYATKYPPLFPLFLSLAWRMQPEFPRTLQTASLLQASLLPVYLAILLLVLRQLGLTWRRTFIVAAMTFVTFPFLFLAVTLYSEVLFGCLLLAAIWTIERSVKREVDQGGYKLALLGGLLTGLAYLTRNAALPMLAAAPIFFLLRKRARLILAFLAVALPIVAGWHIWGALHASGVRTPYLDEFLRAIRTTGLGPHILSQASTLSGAIAEAFLPGIIEFLHGIPLHHLVLAASIAGSVRLGKRQHWPLFLIFTGLYLVMITCWWFQGLQRMIIPVWPMLLVGIAEEANHFCTLAAQSSQSRSQTTKGKQAVRWVMVALTLYIVIRNDAAMWQRIESVYSVERDERRKDRAAYDWIAAHAGPDAIVLTWKHTVAYLYTGVPASHDLFVATIPEAEELAGLRTTFDPPKGFRSALILLLASDLGEGNRMGAFRTTAESVPGSKLEYEAPGAYVYRFPLPE